MIPFVLMPLFGCGGSIRNYGVVPRTPNNELMKLVELTPKVISSGGVDKDTLHALLRVILRATRSQRTAARFENQDGIESLLQ